MKLIRFFLPRLEYVVLLALFWGTASNGLRLLNFDGDLPRHLLVGQLIRQSSRVPTTDTFSFRTEGFPSIPHEWLSQVILSVANDMLGLGGVVLLTAVIITLVWLLVYQETARRSNNLFVNLFILVLGIALSMIHVLPRPHLFTYFFTILWIMVLERVTSDRPNIWWLLPGLMLLWVNMHGMFVLGIIIWSIYLVGSWLENPSRIWFSTPPARSLVLGGVPAIFATFFSPSGIHIWEAITELGSNAYITSRIPEYQSANFHMPETWPFILLLILAIIGFGRNTHKANWSHILLIAAFASIALYTSRMLPLFAVVAVPIIAKNLSELIQQEFSGSRLAATEKNFAAINATSNGWIWILVVTIAVALIFSSGGTIDPGRAGNVFHQTFFPVQAVEWLNQNHQAGHMFNEFDWGGYLLLKLTPQQQIFMDGHTHIYGEALTREYETVVSQAEGWQAVLEKYQITWAIVRTNSSVIAGLREIHWKIIYEDDTATILRKP